jgi:hypothetical protein
VEATLQILSMNLIKKIIIVAERGHPQQFLPLLSKPVRWTPKTGPQVKMDFRWSAGEKKADYESKTETA